MKRNTKRLPALLLAIILCLSLLPTTAWAAFPNSQFYASIIFSSSSTTEGFGKVTQSGTSLTYTKTGAETDRVIYGMESAGGVFFTVEGNRGKGSSQGGNYTLTDDGWRELRVYNGSLTSYRTIGEVTNASGTAKYSIVDTAMDLSGEEPALYGTYQGYGLVGGQLAYCSFICQISLTDGKTSNWLQVSGDIPSTDIIYAMAFDKDGTLYAVGADAGDNGGPATLYTITLSGNSATASKVGEIKTSSGSAISTNFVQDMAFDYANDTLYWAENKENVVYTLDTDSAEATYLGQVKYSNKAYPLQSFCIANDTAFDNDSQYMISVIYTGGGKVTSGGDNKAFYMVNKNGSLTLALTPDQNGKLLSVKVDGQTKPVENLTEYTFSNVADNHVIEVAFRDNLPVTQKNMTWFHYQGRPASFYTQHHIYTFYELPNRINPSLDDVPREGYIQTLLDESGNPIDGDVVILPGNYDVRVTHPGNENYNALNVVYENALQLGKCLGTPGRPVVYGKVGCTQGDLTTTSALQDYYGTNGELIDAAHDEIPVTLVWLNPETTYDTEGNFYASATIYAADELDQRLKDCYTLDDGEPLTEGCLISSRGTQVVVLPANEASLIKVQASDASGGTVSGKGVYKNGDKVTVTATVNENAGYQFKGWQDENGQIISGAGETYTFTANGDRTLTALFKVNDDDYRVTLQTDPQSAGTVTGGGSYNAGEHEATVKATANPGYYFMGWYTGEERKSTDAEYTFAVPEAGITLTAKFGVDLLARAEQAKDNLASALGTTAFEWLTLTDAVDAYKKAEDFVENPPSGVEDAEERFDALTTYYNSVQTLDLSNQNIDSADLAKLALFTGVTDLNLSGNKNVTSLTNLAHMTKLETLDLSNTVIIDLSGLSDLTKLKTLDLSNNTALTDLSGLSGLTKLKTLDLSGDKGVNNLSALKGLIALESLDISDTGVTAFDTLVNENGKIALSNLTTLTAQNLTLTSISDLAKFISEDSYLYIYVKSWDFTGSTLPPKDQNRDDVETIQGKIITGEFIPPDIPDNTYTISASPATLDFGSVYPNYTQPAARTVTITNTGNQPVTLAQPTSEHYILGDISATELAPNGTATFTVQPKPGLDVNTYNETLTVTGSSGDKTVEATVQLQFEVKQQTGGGGGGGGVATYTVTVGNAEHGKVTASPTRAGSGSTVTLTVKPDQGYALDTLTATDAKGNEVKLTDKGNGTYTFTMPASKVKIAASFKESAEQVTNPFTDVFEGDYYYDAVLWAVEQGVTNGTSATTFSPNVTVTRAQMVTFLWRAHGAPAAAGSNPFADVSRDAYYYDAVLWAAANGVTNGTSAAAFSPDAPVTRAQAVTFQWRAHGAPEAAGDSFGDVPADAYYSQAVAWAAANGITNGTGADTFSPEAAVSRAQAVTFLWRELA